MKAIETEIKFAVEDRATLERRLIEAGFRNITERTFERNVLYDTPERRLRTDRQILRIRQYGAKWVVTHKRIPGREGAEGLSSYSTTESSADAADSRHKQRLETETEVEEGQMMACIFENLGFSPVFVYEKWRAEWADDTAHCVIDETPIGIFAELEGPSEWIDSSALRLGVEPAQFLTLSYGRMFETWKAQTASPALNMTFEEICADSAFPTR